MIYSKKKMRLTSSSLPINSSRNQFFIILFLYDLEILKAVKFIFCICISDFDVDCLYVFEQQCYIISEIWVCMDYNQLRLLI